MNEREALEFFASHGIDARRADPDVLNAAYRAIAKKLHPDQGGRPEAMTDLNRAYDVLKAAIKNGSFAREQERERQERAERERQAREQETRAQEARRQAEKERQEQASRNRARTEREERERAEREPHVAEPRQQQVASTVTRVAKAAGWFAMMLVIIMIARLVGQESGRQSAERVRAERFFAEQARAEQARAEQASAEQARAEQVVAQKLATAAAAAKSSDFTTAYSIWAPLAQQGNAVAQNHLGIMHYYGEGVQQDYTKAFEWQMKAAAQGNAAGMLDVGTAYSNGEGVAENDQVGHQWYLQAANKGNAQAQYNVGLNYKDGVGTPPDLKEAKRYLLLAAQQDHHRAQLEVAEMGASASPPDRTAAIFWGAVAAINNIAKAQLFMGDLFLTGKLVPKDHQAAAMWFTLASGYTGKNIEYDNGEIGRTASARLGEIKQLIGAEGLEKAKAAVKLCNSTDDVTAAIGPCGLGGLILANPDGTFSVSPEVKTDVVAPANADFTVPEIYRGAVTYPDFLGRDQRWAYFRTRITEGMKKGVNFAGRLALVEIGCGTGCRIVGVADLPTGQVFGFPMGGEEYHYLNLDYRPDSRMVTARWRSGGRCMKEFLEWQGKAFRHFGLTDIGAEDAC